MKRRRGPAVSNNIFTTSLPERENSVHYYIFCVCVGQSAQCISAGLNVVAASGKRLGNKASFRLSDLLWLSKAAPMWTREANLWSDGGAGGTNTGGASTCFSLSIVFGHDQFQGDQSSRPLVEEAQAPHADSV